MFSLENKMERRQYARLTPNEIPEVLRRPILLNNFEEVKSQIENLSPLGIALTVDKWINIDKGDTFHIKYYVIDSYIKCFCVFSDVSDDNRVIHSYFTDVEDTKAIMEYLK
jgi:hypothetical protein